MYPGKSPFYGSFIKNIEEGLIKNGVHVDKIVIGEYTSSLLKKVFLYLIFYIKIILFKNKYDFIHVSYPSFSFLPLLFRSCNSFLIVRLHGHDLIPNTLLSKLLFIFTYLSLKRANLVVIPSKFFQNKVYKINKDIKTYIYPSGGIDVVKFRNHNYYINNNCLSIGYSGRVVHQKGLHILLKAISMCDFNVTVHVIGKYDYDISYYQSLLKIQKRFNLDVRFYGYISSQELPQYYSLFQLFCFPTMYEESFGNVSIEAMASSVPVLGSRIGALPEYIIHGI